MIDILTKIENLLQESKYYKGKALEQGGTSIKGNVAPGVKWLFTKGYINTNMKILDFGAGKYARNSNWLRDQGCEVYSYDPYNYNGTEGRKNNQISNIIPNEKFDVVFSSFVLNVVPHDLEKDLIKEMERLAPLRFHITRNLDIFVSIKSALDKKDKTVYNFYKNEYLNTKDHDKKLDAALDDEEVLNFCKFGVQTSKGFQRIPELEDYGYKLIRKNESFKIYQK